MTPASKVESMKRRELSNLLAFSILCGLPVLAASTPFAVAQAASATSAYDVYVGSVEARLVGQHRSQQTFLNPIVLGPQNDVRLRAGEVIIEQLTPPADPAFAGSLLHHWRGTMFAPGATVADLERFLKDFDAYPQDFHPQVLQARLIGHHGDVFETSMRVRQQHVLTVVMDATYNVTFGQPDASRGYSNSRSTKISEISDPGTGNERPLNANEGHGFLWRQNTYWSYEERDGGLYMQIESVSLSRSIPSGLAWAVRPFVESIPRESLEFMLRSTCKALKKSASPTV
jgi:hypothetical protein